MCVCCKSHNPHPNRFFPHEKSITSLSFLFLLFLLLLLFVCFRIFHVENLFECIHNESNTRERVNSTYTLNTLRMDGRGANAPQTCSQQRVCILKPACTFPCECMIFSHLHHTQVPFFLFLYRSRRRHRRRHLAAKMIVLISIFLVFSCACLSHLSVFST